ncbi:hypothetical protein [Neomoorella humiferrea]|uniref:hypothetical protein n=1 Tax=Neomoorella humiferrea TaxID=676965 RepID=UPI003D90E5A0
MSGAAWGGAPDAQPESNARAKASRVAARLVNFSRVMLLRKFTHPFFAPGKLAVVSEQ